MRSCKLPNLRDALKNDSRGKETGMRGGNPHEAGVDWGIYASLAEIDCGGLGPGPLLALCLFRRLISRVGYHPASQGVLGSAWLCTFPLPTYHRWKKLCSNDIR
jgi:hypothetical protein